MRPQTLFTFRLLLPLLLLVSGLLHAAENTRWYDVEVVLFAQKSESYRNSEVWPQDYSTPDMKGARQLRGFASDSGRPIPFTQLSSSSLTLNNETTRIKRAKDMELLLHTGWRQPGLPKEKSVAIKIGSYLPGAEALDVYGSNELPAGVTPKPRLEGTLRLILSRYLHIQSDLLYREPNEEAGMPLTAPATVATDASEEEGFFAQTETPKTLPLQGPYHVYRMEQSRRMRSGELHYLDHPVFGLLVRVTPYKAN